MLGLDHHGHTSGVGDLLDGIGDLLGQVLLDLQAAGITSVVWCIGFRPDFEWLDAPVFNGRGQPVHTRGVTQQKGLYFLGLPWQYTWGSGRFSGVSRDAAFLADRIDAVRELCPPLVAASSGIKPTHAQMAMAA